MENNFKRRKHVHTLYLDGMLDMDKLQDVLINTEDVDVECSLDNVYGRVNNVVAFVIREWLEGDSTMFNDQIKYQDDIYELLYNYLKECIQLNEPHNAYYTITSDMTMNEAMDIARDVYIDISDMLIRMLDSEFPSRYTIDDDEHYITNMLLQHVHDNACDIEYHHTSISEFNMHVRDIVYDFIAIFILKKKYYKPVVDYRYSDRNHQGIMQAVLHTLGSLYNNEQLREKYSSFPDFNKRMAILDILNLFDIELLQSQIY